MMKGEKKSTYFRQMEGDYDSCPYGHTHKPPFLFHNLPKPCLCHKHPSLLDKSPEGKQNQCGLSVDKSHEGNGNGSDAEEDTRKQTRKTSLEERTERERRDDDTRRLIRACN